MYLYFPVMILFYCSNIPGLGHLDQICCFIEEHKCVFHRSNFLFYHNQESQTSCQLWKCKALKRYSYQKNQEFPYWQEKQRVRQDLFTLGKAPAWCLFYWSIHFCFWNQNRFLFNFLNVFFNRKSRSFTSRSKCLVENISF